MVLVNGQKYACERCIRGHRVTTCTHTDQPLVLIKPKGRPSTQCSHCKEQRQKKNLHIKCTCSSSKHSTDSEHESSCPCYVTGKCSCEKKTKKSNSKHSPIEQTKETGSETFSDYSSPSITPQSIPPPKSRLSSNSNTNDFFNEVESTLKSPASTSSTQLTSVVPNDVFLNDTNVKSWDMDSPSSTDKLQSLSSSINSTTQSTIPTKDKYSYFQNIQVGMDPIQNFRAVTPHSETATNKRYGEISVPMDEYIAPMNAMNNNLNNLLISVSSPTSEKGELDYSYSSGKSINGGMNAKFDGNTTNIPIAINNSLQNDIKSNQNSSVSLNNFGNSSGNRNGPLSPSSTNTNNYSRSSTRLMSPAADDDILDIPMPMSGNGLLDLFSYNGVNSNINPNHNSLSKNDSSSSNNNNNNNNNNSTNNSNNSSTYEAYKANGLSSSSLSRADSHGPEGYFPLHALVGPSVSSSNYQNSGYTGNKPNNNSNGTDQTDKLQRTNTGSSVNSFSSSLSYSNLNNHNNRYTSGGTNNTNKPLSRNYTGGSNYSSHSLHHPGSHHHHHHNHNHNHNHSHNHGHNNHFSPYPNPMSHSHSHHSLVGSQSSQSQPRRSNSFLSIASAQSIESLNSSNYNLNSPPFSGENFPQMLTEDPTEANKLTNSKTNTTLMDDIYQTKTYTDTNELRKSRSRSQSKTLAEGPIDDDLFLLSPDSMTNQNLLKFQQMDLNNSFSTSPGTNNDVSPNSLNTNNGNTNKPQFLQDQKYIQNYSINPPVPNSNVNTNNKDDMISDKIDDFLLFNQDQSTDAYINDPSIFNSTNSNSNDYTNVNVTNSTSNNINNNNNNTSTTTTTNNTNTNSLNFDDFNSFIQLPQDNA